MPDAKRAGVPRYTIDTRQFGYMDSQCEVVPDYDDDGEWCRYEHVAQLEAENARLELDLAEALEKSRIDEKQCDTMIEDAGRLAAENARLREALELLDRELIEEDGTCHSAGEGLVERWAEVVSKALGREDTDGNE